MTNDHVTGADAAGWWDRIYKERDLSTVSWYQSWPALSLQLTELLGVAKEAAVIDIGGGTSRFAESLVQRGFTDVTVLDVSAAALTGARERAGSSRHLTWMRENVLSWKPTRVFDLWHDRAAFHFLTDQQARDRYVATLQKATRPGSAIVIATFALDGPDHCSGLPVQRYDAEDLCAAMGVEFDLEAVRREVHLTPSGAAQPFTWIAGRRRAA
ncbi:MAG: class I SAM-dependent methyltransferase [Candidatus Dormibacteraeota bacterium]|nr:class I SAM-dependent methyltransferase [Candidatus Dormibacteraeota bacterium]